MSIIILELRCKLSTLDHPFGLLVLKSSGVRFAEVSFRNYLVVLVVWGLDGTVSVGMGVEWHC